MNILRRGFDAGLLFLGLTALIASSGAARAARTQALPPADVFALMEEARSLECRALWPGFEPGKVPAAVFDGQNTYLFGFPSAPKGFAPLAGREGVFVFPGQHVMVRANRRVEIDGVKTAAFVPRFGAQSLRVLAAILIHEKFHVFQAERHPDWRPNDAWLFNYPADTADVVLLRRLEVEAIKRALTSDSLEDARGWAAASLRYRRERLDPLPEGMRRYEDEALCLEGLSEYVEWLVNGLGLFERAYELDFAPAAVKNFAYTGGRWIGLLLDRLDADWKKDIESGAYPHPRAKLAKLAEGGGGKKAFTDAELAALKEKSAADLKAKRASLEAVRRDFEAKTDWRIVIDASGNPLRLRFFLAFAADAFNEREMLHHRWLILANEDMEVEVVGREALTEDDGRANVRRVVVLSPQDKPGIKIVNGRQELRVGGIVLRFSKAAVSEEGRTTLIKLTARPSAR